MRAAHVIAATALVGAALSGLNPARAGTVPVVWSFVPAISADLGPTHTYTSSPVLAPPENIVASGWSGTTSVHLYGKNAGTGEQGLGLVNDTTGDHEITPGSFVQL